MGVNVALSAEGLAQLRAHEGCRLDAYQDEAGVWTIGYGDTLDVQPGQRITPEEAEQRLRDRVQQVSLAVGRVLRCAPTVGQADAMISLAYNVGAAAFAGSTLVAKFNAGDAHGAALEFSRWIHVTTAVQLRRGDSGPEVRQLQRELAGAGAAVVVDGHYGPNTEAAVKAAQLRRGVHADGVAVARSRRISAGLVQRRFWELVRFLQ